MDKKKKIDKIVLLTSTKYSVYGLSESGKLYTLNTEETEWIHRADSPTIKEED